jgi:hypothetical protein
MRDEHLSQMILRRGDVYVDVSWSAVVPRIEAIGRPE